MRKRFGAWNNIDSQKNDSKNRSQSKVERKRTIVFSGINLFSGGPLSVYYDCLNTARRLELDQKYHIICYVHKRELFNEYMDIGSIVELPDSSGSYLRRCYYEYVYFHKVSEKEHIDLWISLHDMTPRVVADRLYTYCHNSSPFMKFDIREAKQDLKRFLWPVFYKYIYRINIKSADGIIVQQDWMRKEFLKMYPIKNVIVARPEMNIVVGKNGVVESQDVIGENKKIFIYAAFPRGFKNFELICEASKKLTEKSINNYEVWLTIDGSENSYSKNIKERYNSDSNIKWLGLQDREKLFDLYNKSDCMIFPSHTETWGLPISEYKMTGKDMLIVDLPYAYETLGTYDKCMFFGENDSRTLAREMQSVILGNQRYQPQVERIPKMPYAENWDQLFEMLLTGM